MGIVKLIVQLYLCTKGIKLMRKRYNLNQSGMSLLEVLIGASIIIIATLALCHQMVVASRLYFVNEMQRQAEARIETKLNWLAGKTRKELKPGGSLTLSAPKNRETIPSINVDNSKCVDSNGTSFCNKLIIPVDNNRPDDLTACPDWPCEVAWTYQVNPSQAKVHLVTRWLVEPKEHGEVRVTVAVFPSEDSKEPITFRQANIFPY
jgi:type II secretory pathway pseudopilin PulG